VVSSQVTALKTGKIAKLARNSLNSRNNELSQFEIGEGENIFNIETQKYER
jgi:hypothetical protein